MANILEGRTAVVLGVANKRSIAWAIAQQMQQAGAQLAITYQNERLKQEADELIAALPNAQAFQCDVSLPHAWKILGGWEAMVGILMFGWSVASLVSFIHHVRGAKIKFVLPPME